MLVGFLCARWGEVVQYFAPALRTWCAKPLSGWLSNYYAIAFIIIYITVNTNGSSFLRMSFWNSAALVALDVDPCLLPQLFCPFAVLYSTLSR